MHALCVMAQIGFSWESPRCCFEFREGREMVNHSSVVTRITAWHDRLLIVLLLPVAAYTCKCLEYYLSSGVQNALSIGAQKIVSMFTGQLSAGQGPSGPGLNDPVISECRVGALVPDLSEKRKSRTIFYGDVRRSPNPLAVPTSVVRRTMQYTGFFTATTPSTFGSKEHVVEVRMPRKPIRAVFRQTAITMLIGLVVGLSIATFGGTQMNLTKGSLSSNKSKIYALS
jgi:hypothetical protein